IIAVRLDNLYQKITNISRRLFLNRPLELLRQRIQRVDDLEAQIIKIFNNRIRSLKIELENFSKTLEVLDPRAILERGFAIVYQLPDRKIIKSINAIAVGEKVGVELKDGELFARAEKVHPRKKSKE
ncbi:MAG: exodeoxyribonuclease VII large subunit, partial [Candidatus Neomarinimicrobiota bacterium]